MLDTSYENLPVHFVEINNYLGAYQAASHLCSLGHQYIGYISSTVRIHNFEERKRGFTDVLHELGLEAGIGPYFSVEPTILFARKFPTALFCECDYIAMSAIKTLTELGYGRCIRYGF
ncbi:substrate-binding domain-containing protein [Paenibacillus sp. P36]|uniref:substrate-binding domain-containing protein n=1 Tax=Paenibacillus sp. P36 TaxID=3342538 RepID=UPI0038B3B5B4